MCYLRIKGNNWLSTKEINFPLTHKVFAPLIGGRCHARGWGQEWAGAAGRGLQGVHGQAVRSGRGNYTQQVSASAWGGPKCPFAQETGRRELPTNTKEFLQLRTESCRMSKNFGTRFVFILPWLSGLSSEKKSSPLLVQRTLAES